MAVTAEKAGTPKTDDELTPAEIDDRSSRASAPTESAKTPSTNAMSVGESFYAEDYECLLSASVAGEQSRRRTITPTMDSNISSALSEDNFSSTTVADGAGTADTHLRASRNGSIRSSPSFTASGHSTAHAANANLPTNDTELTVAAVDAQFRRVATYTICTWLALLCFSYCACPADQFERLQGVERQAPAVAACLIFVSCCSTLVPMFYRRKGRALSGVIIGALAVQFIAMTTDLILATCAVPVILDPVTGTRVYLYRWCSWAPLAFIMTFLTEGAEIPLSEAMADTKASLSDGRNFLLKQRRSSDGGSGHKRRPTNEEKQHKRKSQLWASYMHAWCQGLSAVCGLVFPFCPGWRTWTVVMILSCLFYFVVFFRLKERYRSFRLIKRGTSSCSVELYNWARLSLQLLATCTFMWTFLVLVYFFYTIAPMWVPEGSWIKHHALTMICECGLDVVAKVIYMLIIVDVHDAVFDQEARAERRLEELRQMMSVVWDSSSDMIGISVRSMSGVVTTMLSPTYLKVHEGRGTGDWTSRKTRSFASGVDLPLKALLFELGPKDFLFSHSLSSCSTKRPHMAPTDPTKPFKGVHKFPRKVVPKMLYDVDFNGLPSVGQKKEHVYPRSQSDVVFDKTITSSSKIQGVSNEEISSMADLVVEAWNADKKEVLLMHDLIRKKGKKLHSIRCEAKVTRLEENALVVIVRDISDRFCRFEAEKKVILETTARQKDAEANRFTRHEVKNGLLAAIGLCDSLRETISNELLHESNTMTGFLHLAASLKSPSTDDKSITSDEATESEPAIAPSDRHESEDLQRCMMELDKTLHEILDTILAEAMARDVIHEVYEPKMERVDIGSVISGIGHVSHKSKLDRFPIITKPSPLPPFALDPQLLKYIHRNAVSNACKYGKMGGVILTEVRFDDTLGMLEMDVTNLPGEHHSEILKLGDAARDIVFSPRRRLEVHFKEVSCQNQGLDSYSSGDGAWIMHKCAKTLGGQCDISFKENCTVFSFRCPVTPFDVTMQMTSSTGDPAKFKLPTNIYGIAIDDSKIQRKLLERLFMYAGIKDDRVRVLGSTSDELRNFDDYVVEFIDQHPEDYFLLLVDENLDVVEGAACHVTISGSMSISSIRQRLLPEQERRMMALIRSANDSAHDVAIYNSRAHGYLPKTPIQKDRVLETLAPIWLKRYPLSLGSLDFVERIKSDDVYHNESDDDTDGDALVTLSDLMVDINEIDKLAAMDPAFLKEHWMPLWEKLHSLKGDLLIMPHSGKVRSAVDLITALRGPSFPVNFRHRWKTIRALVVSAH